jgi:hypothetical protein
MGTTDASTERVSFTHKLIAKLAYIRAAAFGREITFGNRVHRRHQSRPWSELLFFGDFTWRLLVVSGRLSKGRLERESATLFR